VHVGHAAFDSVAWSDALRSIATISFAEKDHQNPPFSGGHPVYSSSPLLFEGVAIGIAIGIGGNGKRVWFVEASTMYVPLFPYY
jgi:hypothetical protein